jgi:hypothetical protein
MNIIKSENSITTKKIIKKFIPKKVDTSIIDDIEKLEKYNVSYLHYYSSSKNVKPFKGVNEWKSEYDDFDYSSLPENFRRVLSAFYITENPIIFREMNFATAEHIHHF